MNLRSGKIIKMQNTQQNTSTQEAGDINEVTTPTISVPPENDMLVKIMEMMTRNEKTNNKNAEEIQRNLKIMGEKIQNLENNFNQFSINVQNEVNIKVQTAKEEIRTELQQGVEILIEEGLADVTSQVKLKLTEQDNKIALNTKTLEDIQTHTFIQTAYTSSQKITQIYFYGDLRTHPKVFLNRLRQYLQTIHSNFILKQEIQNVLKAEAEVWYEIIENKFETLEEFENLLLKKYWSEHIQEKVRFDLFNGKYVDDSGISRENYIMRKLYNIKYLEPKLTENEMVKYLSRHFSDDIYNVIITQRITTLDELTEYLITLDDLCYEWQNNNYQINNRKNYKPDYNNYNKSYKQTYFANKSENKYFNHTYNRNRNYDNVNRYNNKYYDRKGEGNSYFENRKYYKYDREQQDRENVRNYNSNEKHLQLGDNKHDSMRHAQITNTNIISTDQIDEQNNVNKITKVQVHSPYSDQDF